MFCNQCGAKLPDGSKFCNNCGADLSALLNKAEEVAPNAAEEPAPQSQPAPVQQSEQPQPAPTPVQQPAQPQPTPVQPQPAPTPVQQPAQPQPTPVQPQPAPVQGMPGYGGQNMNQTYTQPGQMQQNAPNMQQQQFNGYATPGYNPGNPYQQGAMPVQQPKKKSKAPIIIAIVAVIVAALVIVEFTLHPIANLLKPKGNEAATQYAALCDMTSLGTQSYLNARLLTEQLVETDLATADTDSVNELFEKCLAAWDAMELVTEQIDKIAEKLQSLPDFAKLSITKTEAFSLIPVAHAASPGEAASDEISNAQTPQAAVGTATRLSRQLAGDTAGARDNVRRMQQVYNGRQTNLNDWQSATSNTVGSFSAVVFISGEITQANGVTPSSDARGIRSLGNSVKGGGLVLDNTNIVADVGDDTTTFVMGQGTSVVMPDEEIGGSLPGGDSDVITVNTYPEDPNESGISFHENGLSSWFITGRIGGFSITRGSKGEGEEEEIYPDDPVVSGGSFEADPDGDDNSVNEDLVYVCGLPPIEPTRGPITDIIPPIHTDDVVGEVANITRTTGGNGSDSEGTGNDSTTTTPQTGNVDPETLVERIEQEGGGTGDITVSMLWGTHDDLDLHMNTPDGSHIYYSNKTAGGGTLDIDMNAGGELSTSPVENIYFPTPSEGHYKVFIRDYRDRTADMSTHYLVKVLINGQERLFEGDIDNTGTEIVVFEFDYVLPEDPTVIQPPTAENLAEWLSEAGAGVGEITVSLAWNCFDDVDLHMNTPDGSHIYYSHRTGQGGELDVDANAGGGQTMTPVENIYFPMPSNGHYKVWINQYRDRTPDSSADYIVKVTVGENEQIFTGTIDTSGTDIDIVEFDYGGASDGEGSDFEGHRYVFYNDNGQMSWTQAREYCQQQGGHLVTITSAAEQEFINSQYPGKDAWIGGYGDELGFMWITGEDFSYTNWASNQPDNANGDEWYMHLWGGVWNDLNNDDSTYHYHNGFICEWDSMTDLNVERLIHVLDDLDAASGAITVSMMWDSADDLDLHVFTPDGSELYYDNPSVAGGALDIDANRNDDSIMESPVENVYFDDPQPGEYWVYLYDYTDRSDGPTNYIVRVDVGGQSQTFTGTVEGSGDTVEITGFVYGE